MPVHGEEYVFGAACGRYFFPVKNGYFITSSKDGLFLCGRIPDIYYVGNPITGRWETLPQPPKPYGFPENCLSIGLSTNEDDDALGGKIINFRVIIATGCKRLHMGVRLAGSKVIRIETYSSRTREWRRSRLISEKPVKITHARPPSFSGGFFHWHTSDGRNVVAYDPFSLDEEDDICNRGLVLEKKKHVVQVIKAPISMGSKIIWRSDNRQTLWYGASSVRRGVEVFRKRDDSDSWTRISSVESIDSVRKDIIGITQKDIQNEEAISGVEREDIRDHREMVWMIDFIPWDPKLIMIRYWDRIYVYDCIKKKLDHEVMLDGDRQFTAEDWEWYPYFHTLSKSPVQSQT